MQAKASNPKPCLTDFHVFIPSGTPNISITLSSYVGPDLSLDTKREVCNLKVDGDAGVKAILRVYLLSSEIPNIDNISLHKYKNTWQPIKTNRSTDGYVEADIPKGDPPIAVG